MPEAATTPETAPAPQSDLGDIASRLIPLEAERKERSEKIAGSLEAQAKAVNPKLQEAMDAGRRLVAEAEDRRTRIVAQTQGMETLRAEQPSRGLRPFLAPVKGETPEQSITKLIEALSIFGTSIAGSAKGDARAGLAALTGAMQGWQAGDRERADRAYSDWATKMDASLAASEQERRDYRDWFTNANLSVEQMFKGAEMTALMHGNDRAGDIFRKKDLEATQNFLFQWQQHQDTVTQRKDALAQAKALSDRDHYERKREFDVKQAEKAKEQQMLLESYSPEAIAVLGQQWATKGTFPPGLGRTGPQAALRGKITQAGIEWARTNGIDPQTLPAIQQEVRANQMAANALQRQMAISMANVGVFERHMESLVDLGRKVERGKAPVINRYQLQVKGEYQGDADTAVYKAQAYEVAMEFSKVMVGSAQGDAATRDEARKAIDGALNQEQLEAVAAQLKLNAERRLESYREQAKTLGDLTSQLTTAGRATPIAPVPATAGGGALPQGAKREGNKIISDSGKYEWDGQRWNPR